jgi:hypothetical protein
VGVCAVSVLLNVIGGDREQLLALVEMIILETAKTEAWRKYRSN